MATEISPEGLSLYDVISKAIDVQFPFNMLIILGTIALGVTMVGVVASEIRKYSVHRSEVDLKREMVAQGMSVEEIEQVLKAGKS